MRGICLTESEFNKDSSLWKTLQHAPVTEKIGKSKAKDRMLLLKKNCERHMVKQNIPISVTYNLTLLKVELKVEKYWYIF